MDAEQVRDAMLAASGELDPALGGESVTGDTPRRSIYVRRLRNSPDAVLAGFDVASGFQSTAVRDVTTTPGQTLLMLNGSYVLERSAALARRVVNSGAQSDAERVDRAHRLVFGRLPEAKLRDRYLAFLHEQAARVAASEQVAHNVQDRQFEALVDLCHVLLNSNEFLYIE
jgi:hypothetical protein